MKPAIQTNHLTKRFDGVAAVDSLSITIEVGKITSIIGPNGSGKTTLINVLTGMIPISKGTMTIGATTLHTIKPHDVTTHGITRTFQEVRLFEQMTILDNILVVLTARPVFAALFDREGKKEHARAKEVLTMVGLWDKRHARAHECSYGQRKLLEIARALAMDADICLFDEPYAGLFPEMRKVVSAVIQNLKKTGKTIILIEHDMPLIREMSDHVIVMDSGKLLAEGTPEAVLGKREVIEAYLGE